MLRRKRLIRNLIKGEAKWKEGGKSKNDIFDDINEAWSYEGIKRTYGTDSREMRVYILRFRSGAREKVINEWIHFYKRIISKSDYFLEKKQNK